MAKEQHQWRAYEDDPFSFGSPPAKYELGASAMAAKEGLVLALSHLDAPGSR